MFKVRLISGIILVAAALFFILSGGYILYTFMLAVSVIAAGELYKATGVRSRGTFGCMDVCGYLCILFYYLTLISGNESLQMMSIVYSLLAAAFVYVFKYPEYNVFNTCSAFFGIVYCGVMLSFIYRIRCLDNGSIHVWLVFISAWGCDTCAYCVGMLIGKHKMSPVLSPKKSIEGAVGGVLGAVVLGIVYALILRCSVPVYALICAAGALISMVGDLAASAIKRNMNIKDYGDLIPGHGGVLDRFDSIIFTAPIIYYLSYFLLS